MSYDAATLLSGIIPVDITANSYYNQYCRYKQAIEREGTLTQEKRNKIKRSEAERALNEWKQRAEATVTSSGSQIRAAILPIFNRWMNRNVGQLTYEMTQIVTGHGSFNYYLWRFKKRISPACIYCSCRKDDNIHVIMNCPKWNDEREELRNQLQIMEFDIANILLAAIRALMSGLPSGTSAGR